MARRFDTAPQGEPETPPAVDAGTPPPVDGNPPPPDAPPAPTEPEKLTPDEWARKKGLIVERTDATPWVEAHAKGFHAEASVLHGWGAYAYSEQDPKKAFRLLEADYDAALKAAAEYPAVPAHAAALPPGVKAPPLPKHVEERLAAEAKAKAEGAKPSGV